jgi:hypothetical protein
VVDRLQHEVESHQQVIDELTMANRSRPVPLSQEVRAMITSAHQNPPPQIRLKALLRALGIAARSGTARRRLSPSRRDRSHVTFLDLRSSRSAGKFAG